MFKKFRFFSVLIVGLALISLIFLGITRGLSTELEPTADARVEQSDPLKNFGTSINLIVRSKFDGETVYDNMRSFIIFDLSSLPADATISSATLKLYMQDAPGIDRTYEVYRVVETWDESTITWDNQPGVESTATSSTLTGTSDDVWLSWDVTTDVLSFYSGSLTNYGWMIGDMTEDSGTGRESQFRSREYSDDETLRPELEIIYTTTTSSTTSTTSSTTESTTTESTTTTTTSSTTTTTTSTTTTTTTTTTTSTSTTTTTMPQITGTFIRFINSEDLGGVINNVNGINLADYTPTYIHVYGYLKRFEDRISGLITFTSVGSLEVTRTLYSEETIVEERGITISLVVKNFDSCLHFARNRMNCRGSGILMIHGAGKDTRLELNGVEFDIKDDLMSITGDSSFSVTDMPIRIMNFY